MLTPLPTLMAAERHKSMLLMATYSWMSIGGRELGNDPSIGVYRIFIVWWFWLVLNYLIMIQSAR